MNQPVSTPPIGEEVHRSYAGLVSRLAALAVDAAVLCALTIAVRLLPGVAWTRVISQDAPLWLDRSAAVLAVLLPWLYFTICWWVNGQTVGDMLIGVAVRNENGRDLTLLRAAIRAGIGLLVAPLWMLGLIFVLVDRRRRALHDLVFATVVAYTAPPRTQAREVRRGRRRR